MVNTKGMCSTHIPMFFFVSYILFASIAIPQREGIPSRDRRPSDKVAAQHIFFSHPLNL